jgi:glycine cleavage system H protein
MKEIDELIIPGDVRYAPNHEWARLEGETVRVGISDYAQDQLGDITFVEMPNPGDSFDKGAQFGTLESTKAAAELYMPISGEVIAVNVNLAESPGFINEDPYRRGWIVDIVPTRPAELDDLMDRRAYVELLKGLA